MADVITFLEMKMLTYMTRQLVNYNIGDTVLGISIKEKDLEVTVSADMKVSEQCVIAASKGNRLVRRNTT